MMKHRITLLGSLDKQLKEWLLNHPSGHERGAIILFRRLASTVKDLPYSDRFLAIEMIIMDNDWILESSEVSFKINMRKFPDIYLRCEKEGLELGFIHSHPNSFLNFSEKDDQNEINILHGLSGCNKPSSLLISMILSGEKWIARVREGKCPNKVIDIRHISILSEKIELHGFNLNELPASLKRQEAAFGRPFNAKLQTLRVAVVGLGGTGSAVATLLARTGIGELILIDGDVLDKTNMNRVRGYVGSDIGKKKSKSLAKFIKSLNLNVKVVGILGYLNEPASIDALSTADVVFGCTDDIYGRELMNHALYYYSQVYIDSGMSGNVDEKGGDIYLRSQKGRVSCILPEHGACLRCQNVVNDNKLAAEQTLKDRPELAKLDAVTLEKEYYIFGGNVQSPGIGAFTSATSDNAVATLMNLIKEFRVLPPDLRQDNIWIDFVNLCIHSNTPIDNPDCIFCRKQGFLLKSNEKFRLGIPQLGKIKKG